MHKTNLLVRVSNGFFTLLLGASAIAFMLFGWSGTGLKALSVPTGSMQPAISKGSLVLVRRVPATTLRVGDVITYINPVDIQSTISHRIVRTYTIGNSIPAFVTKGDANKTNDIPITSGSVIGKVEWHVPYIGYILLAAKQPYIILPFIYMMALPIILEELKRLSDYYKARQPYILFGYIKHTPPEPTILSRKAALGAGISLIAILVLGATVEPVALAMLKSNTVSLTGNHLSVAAAGSCDKVTITGISFDQNDDEDDEIYVTLCAPNCPQNPASNGWTIISDEGDSWTGDAIRASCTTTLPKHFKPDTTGDLFTLENAKGSTIDQFHWHDGGDASQNNHGGHNGQSTDQD